ncbi:hypothetical protein HK104_010849 [Borealophlyctis nickersoniae]|nr:hypothetical protein HK104_010849 [Borealophlyctis nickersoniae]
MDVDVPAIDEAPVDDAMPLEDLPAPGSMEAGDMSSTPAIHHRPLADVDDVDLAKGINYTLQTFDMTRLNHTEFHGFREFFSTTRDPRCGNTRARNAQTINKARERICGYLGWLKESGRVKHPSFSDFEDVDTFLEKYVDGYLLQVRGLSHGTVANAITAAIDVLKFRQAQSEDPFAPFDCIAKLKNRRNKEQTLAERERRLTIEDGNASILWEQFLECVRCQRLVVERLWTQGRTGKKDSMPLLVKEMQKYLALTFYSAIPPSRSKEIRLIIDRILSQSESQKCLQNYIALVHGRHVLVVSDYKNRHTNGLRDSMELPSNAEIILKYLEHLLQPTVRAQVTKGKQHGFLFCKQNGEAFENAGEWSMYIAGIIERHAALQNISTNALRHSFTTYMESVEGEGDHTRLRESTAYAMRHTVRFVKLTSFSVRVISVCKQIGESTDLTDSSLPRIQQHTYNNIPPIERKRKAVEFASRAFKRVVCEEEVSDSKDSHGASIRPPTGSLVGTRLPDGSPAFAKVIRIEGDDAVLMLLRLQQEDSIEATPNHYVANLGSLVRKRIASREILFPVDGVFHVDEGMYEVMTSLKEVDRLLVGQKGYELSV